MLFRNTYLNELFWRPLVCMNFKFFLHRNLSLIRLSMSSEVLSYKLLHHYQNHSSNVLVLTRPNLDLPVFSLPHLHYAKWQSQLNTPQHPRLTWSYLAHFPFFLMPISWWAIGKDWRKLWKSLSKTNRHREKAPEPLSFVHQPVQVETEGLESSIHLGSGID